ncbi:DNA-binding pseudobarrel domain-containing protein [Tanacetum coccineum]
MAGVEINTLTMEQYLALSRENQALGLVKPEIGGNVNFEIKSQFMRELREDTFFANKNEDAHDHIDRVLNIVSLFNILGVSKDAVLLRVFPFTLTGSAKRWVDRLTPGAVNTWDLLKKAIIQRYCPPSKTAKQLEEIHNFKQESDESLYQAWERYNDLLYKCPTHDINSHQKVEEVKYGEFGCPAPFNRSNGAKFRVGPPGYYTRTDNRPPYGAKRLSLKELMNKHQEESAQRSAQMNEWIKKLQENAEINTRNQSASLKNLETQIEQLTKELRSRTTNGAPSSSTGQCKVLNADHETPNIPIASRSSVNVMPGGIFEFLKLTNLRKTNMLIEMVDMTKKAPLGVVENILVGIDKFLFSSDFGNFTWGSYEEWYKENSHDNKPRPRAYTFREWMIVKVGHTNVNESVKKALLKSWVINCFKEELDPDKDRMERSFDDYKWVFDLEIDQLADEYKLGIGKKGHILEMI